MANFTPEEAAEAAAATGIDARSEDKAWALRVAAARGDDRVRLVHGCSGEIRFTREPLPLLRQWWRNLRQLIQKRYEI